jgi:hypothetical protein
MKKMQIGNRLYSVVKMEEYTNNPELYNPKLTAIERDDVILPIRNKSNDVGPGIYYQTGAMVAYVEKPDDPEMYSPSRMINYDKAESIDDIMKNNQLIRDIQNDIITTSENILYLKIGDEDTPEMKALKTAINAKQVDKAQYEHRFPQFQNDMRLLKGPSITLAKLVSISSAFDIGVELTLRDKQDCPNPMHQEINIDLTEGRNPK